MNRLRLQRWRLVGVVAGVAAFAATAALATTRHGGPALAAGPLGPEGVPIPAGRPLAPPRRLHDGEQIDGISCQADEQVAFHVHVHLAIAVRGRSRRVPAGIGIAAPYEVASTPAGPFVAGASCFMWLHTHAADGIVHIESPVQRTYTLGEFFDVWGEPLTRHRVAHARGQVTSFVDGRAFTGDPRRIPLLAHRQIELEVGRPLVAPQRIAFPSGL
jgi:hypothetical protein